MKFSDQREIGSLALQPDLTRLYSGFHQLIGIHWRSLVVLPEIFMHQAWRCQQINFRQCSEITVLMKSDTMKQPVLLQYFWMLWCNCRLSHIKTNTWAVITHIAVISHHLSWVWAMPAIRYVVPRMANTLLKCSSFSLGTANITDLWKKRDATQCVHWCRLVYLPCLGGWRGLAF